MGLYILFNSFHFQNFVLLLSCSWAYLTFWFVQGQFPFLGLGYFLLGLRGYCLLCLLHFRAFNFHMFIYFSASWWDGRAQWACLQQIANIRKKHAPGNLAHVSYGFCHFVTVTSGCPISMQAALRRSQAKHAPGLWACTFCVLQLVLVLLYVEFGFRG